MGGEVEAWVNVGRTRSWSGGGVGGKTLRFCGGSDCCLDLLCRPTLTRLLAAYDIESGGRSSMLLLWPALNALASELADPA